MSTLRHPSFGHLKLASPRFRQLSHTSNVTIPQLWFAHLFRTQNRPRPGLLLRALDGFKGFMNAIPRIPEINNNTPLRLLALKPATSKTISHMHPLPLPLLSKHPQTHRLKIRLAADFIACHILHIENAQSNAWIHVFDLPIFSAHKIDSALARCCENLTTSNPSCAKSHVSP